MILSKAEQIQVTRLDMHCHCQPCNAKPSKIRRCKLMQTDAIAIMQSSALYKLMFGV